MSEGVPAGFCAPKRLKPAEPPELEPEAAFALLRVDGAADPNSVELGAEVAGADGVLPVVGGFAPNKVELEDGGADD